MPISRLSFRTTEGFEDAETHLNNLRILNTSSWRFGCLAYLVGEE